MQKEQRPGQGHYRNLFLDLLRTQQILAGPVAGRDRESWLAIQENLQRFLDSHLLQSALTFDAWQQTHFAPHMLRRGRQQEVVYKVKNKKGEPERVTIQTPFPGAGIFQMNTSTVYPGREHVHQGSVRLQYSPDIKDRIAQGKVFGVAVQYFLREEGAPDLKIESPLEWGFLARQGENGIEIIGRRDPGLKRPNFTDPVSKLHHVVRLLDRGNPKVILRG